GIDPSVTMSDLVDYLFAAFTAFEEKLLFQEKALRLPRNTSAEYRNDIHLDKVTRVLLPAIRSQWNCVVVIPPQAPARVSNRFRLFGLERSPHQALGHITVGVATVVRRNGKQVEGMDLQSTLNNEPTGRRIYVTILDSMS